MTTKSPLVGVSGRRSGEGNPKQDYGTRMRARYQWYLDTLYPPPPPTWCLHESTSHRYFHLDIASLALGDLIAELAQVKRRIEQDRNPDPWFLERRARIAGELEARRRG